MASFTRSPPAPPLSELQARLEGEGVKYAIASFVDIHGICKGKKVADLFRVTQVVPLSHMEGMFGGSELFTGAALDGVPQEVCDDEIATMPDAAGCTVVPWKREVVWFPSDLYLQGKPFEACSRGILKRQLAAALELGYTFNLGIETEFYVFKELPNGKFAPMSERDVLDKPAYDVTGFLDNYDWVDQIVQAMDNLGWDVYSFDHEDGNGQFETDFGYSDALTVADRFTFFRLMAKEIAHKHGYFASFIPKPFGDRTVIAPTVNSYKRLIAQGSMSGFTWAPVYVCYGGNNRTNMLRIPMSGRRVECRAADISTNLYLGAAIILAAGLEGVKNNLDPGEPHMENMYKYSLEELREKNISMLPRTLGEAVEAFAADPLSKAVFGESMFKAFVDYKSKEWEEYHCHVSDWEIKRYLKLF
eukprot:SM000417S15261  [mRNA]  locus=s417:26139:29804:+ [translate_table: standard]